MAKKSENRIAREGLRAIGKFTGNPVLSLMAMPGQVRLNEQRPTPIPKPKVRKGKR